MVQISPEEVTALATAFKDTAYVQANGFTVGGDKFFAIRADDRSIYGKLGEDGVVCVRTNQTILIAHYSKPVTAGEAIKVTEAMADYLVSVNF